MQRQAIAARARPDVMQPGTRANGEAMGAGPPVYSGDAAADHYFYQQYGSGGGMPRSMMMGGGLPPMMAGHGFRLQVPPSCLLYAHWCITN